MKTLNEYVLEDVFHGNQEAFQQHTSLIKDNDAMKKQIME
jgi:hypothetical protein